MLDHHEILYRYAYRLTGSVADAEDLTQQTFLVAHEKLGQVRQADSVQGWLFTVLRNGYLKNRRRLGPGGRGKLGLRPGHGRGTRKPTRDRSTARNCSRSSRELADEFKLVLLLFYFEAAIVSRNRRNLAGPASER